jgi:heparin binding hemagglutinin HbhA
MSVNLPTAHDVRKARRQATVAVAGAFEQARMPLYAALGAGDLATEAVVTYAKKARGNPEVNQARVAELQARLAEMQARLAETPASMSHLSARLRAGMHELNTELTELRGRLETTDLSELVEGYRRALLDLYGRLAVRGERVYGQIVAQPQVKRAVSRVGNAADTAEVRVERFVEEARVLADEVLGRVSARTREAGDQAAGAMRGAAAGGAEATRGVTRTAADRIQPAKPVPHDTAAGPATGETTTGETTTGETTTGETTTEA